jgi:hypothetical protein
MGGPLRSLSTSRINERIHGAGSKLHSAMLLRNAVFASKTGNCVSNTNLYCQIPNASSSVLIYLVPSLLISLSFQILITFCKLGRASMVFCHREKLGKSSSLKSTGPPPVVAPKAKGMQEFHITNARSAYVHLSPTSQSFPFRWPSNTPTTRLSSWPYRFWAVGSFSG